MSSVYRHFDKDDNLLYVGRSVNPLARLGMHKYQSDWFDQIATVKIERFDAHEDAVKAEEIAIRVEKPIHNIQCTKPVKLSNFGPKIPRKHELEALERENRLAELHRQNRVLIAISNSLPESEREEFWNGSLETWKSNNPGVWEKFDDATQ
jgi:predicted GIY-YIG superfamily endonuclease